MQGQGRNVVDRSLTGCANSMRSFRQKVHLSGIARSLQAGYKFIGSMEASP